MTTVNEMNNEKTKVLDELIFLVFCSFVLLPNSMSKLIHNRSSTCKLIIKTTAAYAYAHEHLRVFCFCVCLVRYFAALEIHL